MSDRGAEIITDIKQETPVPPSVTKAVKEYERATGIKPEIAPRPSTPENPRAHLPKYKDKMQGELPDDHPAVRRRTIEMRRARAREEERDRAVAAREASVPQRLRLNEEVEVTGSAKVDFREDNGERVHEDYRGICGKVYQTYVDQEGVRRHIVRSPEGLAPIAVRECDLTRRSDRVTMSLARRTTPQERADHRAKLAAMSQEDRERRMFGGLTARELADRMCGI